MNSYLNVWSSVMNVCTRFRAATPDLNLGDIQDFDDTDGTSLPAGNLLGIYQLNYNENNSLILAQVGFVMSTERDVSSLKLNTGIGNLVKFVRDQSTHPFYNYDTKSIIGHMRATNNLAVSPMTNTKSRQFKTVLQSFLFDQTATLQV